MPSRSASARGEALAALTGTVRLHGRALRVRVSEAAARVLAGRAGGTVAELELYFSCLVRKRVRFLPAGERDRAELPAGPAGLRVRLRPVAGRACAVEEAADGQPLEALPVARPEAFVPRWLHVDAGPRGLVGTFGFTEG